ncbi:hypothetical protein [Leisingera aquaemixtae]|uniref:hypothetical protein n=1 Tax=Leisingera aquaemixtae TaxID=1396826 RepID=UPI0021BDCCD5|nr:hypothetical protein [Leisingera aquaemixtae]
MSGLPFSVAAASTGAELPNQLLGFSRESRQPQAESTSAQANVRANGLCICPRPFKMSLQRIT